MLRWRARRIRRRSQVVVKLVMWEITTDPTWGLLGQILGVWGWGQEWDVDAYQHADKRNDSLLRRVFLHDIY